MEKVKILDVVMATAKNGKNYFKISLEDGRKGTSFNPKFMELKGHEANIEITKNGDYNNMDIPKEQAQSKLDSPQHIKLEIAKAVACNPIITNEDQVVSLCNVLFKWVTE